MRHERPRGNENIPTDASTAASQPIERTEQTGGPTRDHIKTTRHAGKLADQPNWMRDLFAQLSGA
ncbi:hypothetical protein [Halovenus aranensis]|uniref:hypothetical protein n=1 Tax=Halovenus aranensis TaxID=890420 RepID=UPI000B823351|nr:hypothetical protein [Halovenus aranensis]